MQITVRAPASTSNLGPGFDIFGLALSLYSVSLLSVLKRSRFPAVRKLFKMKTIWCFKAFEKSSVKPGRRPFP